MPKMGALVCGFREDANEENSALKVFLVIKNIFRHLPNSDLFVARLVNRNWNFAAMSELAFRKFQLSTTLCSSSSNQFGDRDYNWYLDFENGRRSFWTNLYGTDCPIIKFRHLHFGYPDKIAGFFKVLRSPWLLSVTSLTLSMYAETCEELVINWFLPASPYLKNLSCYLKSASEVEDIQSSFGDSVAQNSRKFSTLHSFSVCIEDACRFPWNILGCFPELEDLKLEFNDTTSLIKSADNFDSEMDRIGVANLEITLTHKPNLKEQVEEAELHGQDLSTAVAKLCNKFPVTQSLSILSMIPAAHFFGFANELTAIEPKHIKLEIAVPFYMGDFMAVDFMSYACYLVLEILFKFPNLSGAHLQYLQHHSTTDAIRFPQNRQRARSWKRLVSQGTMKQLYFSTIPVETEPDKPFGSFPVSYLNSGHCQWGTLYYASLWFEQLIELVVEISGWEDCVEIVDMIGPKLKCLKKLIFQRSSGTLLAEVVPKVRAMYFFPEMGLLNFQKKWYPEDNTVRPEYEGLPVMQSLEVFRIEQFAVYFDPLVLPEIRKMHGLKWIHLDPDFNDVIPAESAKFKSLFELLVREEKVTRTWPSSVDSVQITKT